MNAEFNAAQTHFSNIANELNIKLQTATIPVARDAAKEQLKCYDKWGENFDQIQRCVQSASTKMEQVQKNIQADMNSVQTSIQSCVTSCERNFSSQFQNTEIMGDPVKRMGVEKGMSDCAIQCLKSAEKDLKSIESRANDYVKNAL